MAATIIQFKPKESTAFVNMKGFFEICNSLDTCNFYLDCVEVLAEQNEITEKEKFTLRRIGRQKRIELAHPPKKTKEEVNGPGTYLYTPEMGQEKPDCQIEASLSYYGKHYYLYTNLELKGRGITPDGTDSKGRKCYRATMRAYKQLQETYSISYESLLD
jgi:hypothetical protein